VKAGELFVQLGINADTPKAKEFQDALMGAALKATGLIAVMTGVSMGLRDMVQDTLGAAVGFQKFENASGLSSERLQQWHNMAERANVSTEAVTDSVLALQRNMAEIRLGRGNIAPFQMLGISPNQDPFAILNQVQRRIQGMNRPMAVNLMQQLGINPDMINLLGKTSKELAELASPRMILSQQNVAKLLVAQRAIKELRIELTAFSRQFIADISPAIRGFSEFIVNIGSIIHNTVEYLKEFPEVLKVIAISLASVLAIMHPWIAAMTAALLLIEDIYTYHKGGKSAIGSIIGSKDEKTQAGWAQRMNVKYPWLGKLDRLTGIDKSGQKKASQMNNKVDIHVNTTANADETAKKTKDAFDTYVDTTAAQLDNGGF
jgi:hypothetical protein